MVVDIAANQRRMIRLIIIKQNSLTFKAVVWIIMAIFAFIFVNFAFGLRARIASGSSLDPEHDV